jgi:hypothetical protein
MNTNNVITQQLLQSFSDYKELTYCMDNGDCFPTMIFANGNIYSMNSIGQWFLKFNYRAFN